MYAPVWNTPIILANTSTYRYPSNIGHVIVGIAQPMTIPIKISAWIFTLLRFQGMLETACSLLSNKELLLRINSKSCRF